jgi:tRNA threonylcarbamoyladenosine biosynthesis protein TsaB
LGLALDKPLVHVPTVDALAWNLWGSQDLICPIMDARRNQVYTGIYRFEGEAFKMIREQTPMALAELADVLNQLGEKVTFVGDGIPVYQEQLSQLLTVPYQLAPAHLNRQRASAVAVLAMQYVREGRTETAAEHAPDYLRMSQAERERAEAQKRAESNEISG